MSTFGLLEAAAKAQMQLRDEDSCWMNERPMMAHRSEKDMDLTTGLLRKPLAETAISAKPLQRRALRLRQLGGEENALWLTDIDGPDGVPLDACGRASRPSFGPKNCTVP